MFENDETDFPRNVHAAIERWKIRYAPTFRRIGRPGPVTMKVRQELGLKLGLIPGRCGVISGILVRSTGG
jgi:hypothetical protein